MEKIWQFLGVGIGEDDKYDEQQDQFYEFIDERLVLAAAERPGAHELDEIWRWWAGAIPRLEAMPLLWKKRENLEALVAAIEWDFGGTAPSISLKQPVGAFVRLLIDAVRDEQLLREFLERLEELERSNYGERAVDAQVRAVVQRRGRWTEASLLDCLNELEYLGGGAADVEKLFGCGLLLTEFRHDLPNFREGRVSFDAVREWLQQRLVCIVRGVGSWSAWPLGDRLCEMELMGAHPAFIGPLFVSARSRVSQPSFLVSLLENYDRRAITYEVAHELLADYDELETSKVGAKVQASKVSARRRRDHLRDRRARRDRRRRGPRA